jgi:assimilatory nitrate reductase catalytic subunit
VPPANIEKAAHWIGEADRAMGLHARGIEHHSKGVENCLAMINLFLATGNFGREGAGCMMITGQGNGQGGREHGQKCDQLPGARSITDPEARASTSRGLGDRREETCPAPACRRVEIMEAIHRGEIKALFSMCFNPLVSLPDAQLHARGALEARVLRRHRLLHVRNRAPRRRRLRRQPARGGRRRDLQRRRPRAEDQQGRRSARQARSDALISATWRASGWQGQYFPSSPPRARSSTSCGASQGGIADYYGITWERIEQESASSGRAPRDRPPRHAAAVRGRPLLSPDGKAHISGHRMAARGRPADAEFPLYLTTGRVVSQYLSGTQTRRIGPLVEQYPEPQDRDAPAAGRAHGIATATG